MRMDFGIQRLRPGEAATVSTDKETLWVLLDGSVAVQSTAGELTASRSSLFDENPTAVHAGTGEKVAFKAGKQGAELAIVRTSNAKAIGVRYYQPSAVTTEDRGAGLAQGACRRAVRAIFDYSTRPDSNLVVGEVVNLPGRWSSYPPHHHPQPEIYHYRFTLPQGYGHAEVGDDVFKVRSGDTTRIPGGLDHAQVSAPGYGMYYLWIVRHLPGRPYKGFKFTAEHTWLLDAKQQGWAPSGILSQ
jgi:5-deoxy-glucuronate isomerase